MGQLRGMTRPGFSFFTPLRVRYSEIDGQKIVFNSRYLEYADVALSEYWRALKLSDIPAWADLEFNVVRASVDYKAPLRYDDRFNAYVRTAKVGTSSLTTQIELVHADTGALHTVIEIIHVNVDLANQRAQPIPAQVRSRMMTDS